MQVSFDTAVKNTKKNLNPNHIFTKEGRQAAADPLEFFKTVEVPAVETPGPAPTRDDAADAANGKKKRVRSRAATVFTSPSGLSGSGSSLRAVLLGD